LLPAGPLREPVPTAVPEGSWVVYNAPRASTPLPGMLMRTSITNAVPLASWQNGQRQGAVPIAGLRGPPILAAAGIAEPERFFRMLDAAGLTIQRLPLPDHHRYDTLPWPEGTPEVVLTEKDAAKLVGRDIGATKVWVVALDSALPDALVAEIVGRLPPRNTS
jgi:tetraacyldisaccharide 4'-kinase